jgi:hypothetical protein
MMVSRARSIIAVEPDDTDGRMYRSISHGFLPVSEFGYPTVRFTKPLTRAGTSCNATSCRGE